MKLKTVLLLAVSAVILTVPQAVAAEEYDPQHTVLALDMAIVSIQRIINTQDRAVLDMEYRNIISNLKLGNIESDPEIIELYQELMNVISGKLLTREAAELLQKNYDAWEHQILMDSLSNIHASGENKEELCATFAL